MDSQGAVCWSEPELLILLGWFSGAVPTVQAAASLGMSMQDLYAYGEREKRKAVALVDERLRARRNGETAQAV